MNILKIVKFKFRVVEIFKLYLDVLMSNDVKPYIVFDGLPLPAKKEESANRLRYKTGVAKTWAGPWTTLWTTIFLGFLQF
jgi:hypothetical protein